jgi:DNA-binding MarR family transcriptional regulator
MAQFRKHIHYLCEAQYEKLALNAVCSVSTIQRSLKRLDAAGHIQRKTKGNKGRIYILTDVTAKGVETKPRFNNLPTRSVNPFLTTHEAVDDIPIQHPSLEEEQSAGEIMTEGSSEGATVPVTYELMTEEVDDDVPF